MTRARQPKPTAPPLATTLRQALASDWRTLAALDTLTAARGSDARRLVHEALKALRAEGAVLEERVGKGGVEVRLLTLPAPVPDDGQPGDFSPEDIEAIRASLLEEEDDASDGAAYSPSFEIAPLSPAAAARTADLIEHPPAPSEALRALLAPAPPVDQAVPVEAAGAPAQPQPGPSSRCANCGAAYKRHDEGGATKHVPGTCAAFKALPRGRPARTPSMQPPIPNAAPAVLPRARQRRTRGSIVDVDGGRVERASDGPAEPETSRGGSDVLDAGTLDAIQEVIDTAPQSVRERVRARRKAAEMLSAKPASSGCRPPLCYRDDIHEPARVRGFARALCETHRAWVEGAGGTVASAADAAALHAARDGEAC